MKNPLRFYVLILLSILCLQAYSQEDDYWFNVSKVGPKIWLIDDNRTDNIYVVEGEDKALIIDTGIGTADLLSEVKKITDKPLIVVNTHAHPDHSGGNYQFEKVYIHDKDMEAATAYGEKPDPDEKYKVKVFETKLIPVSDGYIFDLGGRKIEVMETPGHTPGSICLLDINNKLLFSGDNNNSLVWLFLDVCLPLSEYLKTLEMQVSRLDEFTTLYPGHGPNMPSEFVKDQVGCVKAILNGSCKGEPYESFAGDAKICSFGNAKVAFNPENL